MTLTQRPHLTVTIQDLVRPITGENPTGRWLRYEPIYDQIRQARHFDDPTLSQGIWERELKKSDWETVEALCCEVLCTQSKDLQVAGWLAEAWLALDELPGLVQGLQLLKALCQNFWADLYPPIDNDDLEYRLRVLEWLNHCFMDKIIHIPLTGSDIKEHGFTLADWIAAHQLETAAKRSPESQKLIESAENKNQPTVSQFNQSLILTEQKHLNDLRQNVMTSMTALIDFRKTVDQFTANQCPSYSETLNHLEQIARLITRSQANSTRDGQQEPADTETSSLNPPASPPDPQPAFETLTSRHIAYQQLQRIAQYLDHIEPHSPTPHILKILVSWQNKTLADIFTEFGDSSQDLNFLARLMGKKVIN